MLPFQHTYWTGGSSLKKIFEQAEREDKLGAILTLHYESLKKVIYTEFLRRMLNFEIFVNENKHILV